MPRMNEILVAFQVCTSLDMLILAPVCSFPLPPLSAKQKEDDVPFQLDR